MSLQITRGKKLAAVRGIFSGTEGIGKSTLATKIPNSLVIDIEDSTSQIDCARVNAADWRAIEHVTKELIADTQGFGAIIYDTADWLERALIEHMLKQAGKKSIEDFGYGKGYTILQEHFSRFLSMADQLIAKGVHVVFVAHTKSVRVSPPDQTDGYDRYELKLTKQVSPLLKEWADLYLFANYKIQIVEGTDGRLKAQGGKERVMYANRCAAWDAKNRFGLPDEMPMTFDNIAHLFGNAAPRNTPTQAKAAAVEAAIVADPTPAPAASPATKEQVEKLTKLVAEPHAAEMIESALSAINGISVDELTEEQAAQLLVDIEAATPKPLAKSKLIVPPTVATWLDANAEKVNAYLVKVKWLKPGETWREIDQEKADSIIERAPKFANAAGIPTLGEKAAA